MFEQAPLSASSKANFSHLFPDEPVNPQKRRKGLSRVLHATGYSIAGLRAGWHETAFRQEAIASIVLVPAAFWLGRNWAETALLAGTWTMALFQRFFA